MADTNFIVKNGLESPVVYIGTSGVVSWNTSTSTLQFSNDGGSTSTDLGGGGGGVTISDTAPSSPAIGDLWYESDTGSMFVYYDNFWVEVIAQTGPVGPVDPVFQSMMYR